MRTNASIASLFAVRMALTRSWCLGSAVSLICVAPAAGHAQHVPPHWGGLQPGPHGVGFTVISTYDYTRAYWPRIDYRGVARADETARPVQLTLWYPADIGEHAPGMPFREYFNAAAGELGAGFDTTEARQHQATEFRRGPLSPYFVEGVPDSAFVRIQAMPVRAMRDAPRSAGRFPVIIHPGPGGALTQSTLFEYLASHGYIVISTPLLGTGAAWHGRGEWSAEALLDAADDVGFVIGWLRELTSADPARVAVIGMGAHAGLLYEMREMRLAAIASLEGSYHAELRAVPGFGVDRLRVPMLDVGNTQFLRDTVMFDSLRYSQRYRLRLREAPHAQFYQFWRIAQSDRAREHVQYEVVARYTLAFLDAHLKRDSLAIAFLREEPVANGFAAGYVTVEQTAALAAAPTAAEFLALIRSRDMDEAARVYYEVKGREPAHRIFGEQEMITVLRFLGRDHGAAAAMPAAELLVDAYPRSAGSRELIGSLYEQSGRKHEALREFETALGLLEAAATPASGNERIRDRLRKSIARLR